MVARPCFMGGLHPPQEDFLARMQTFFWGKKAAVCKPSSSRASRASRSRSVMRLKEGSRLVEGRGVKVCVYSRHMEDIV